MIKYVLLAILLTGCSDSEPFKNTDPKKDYTVHYEYVDDVNKRYEEVWSMQTKIIIEKEEVQSNQKRLGFSYNVGNKCMIVLSNDPLSQKELETTIGHEHLHCIYGAFHK